MSYLDFNFRSKILDLNTCVSIILPDDIKPNEKLRVLYLLHGYIGNHTDWMRFSSIERYASQYRLAIIMPEVNNSYYTDMKYGLPYFSYITDELPQIISNIFPLSVEKEDQYICGLSMGGYGAFKIALTYPERFKKAASLSGVLDIDHVRSLSVDKKRDMQYIAVFGEESIKDTSHDLKYLVKKMKQSQSIFPELFIGCGTEDFLFEDNEKFKAFLDSENVSHTYDISEGAHDWKFWDTCIQKVLIWMNNK
ncbi:MAG: esterase family protein [Acholeplasmataceae bacterium]|nr:esterase family protein [Acholeplasmataceae bacterium]